MSSSEVWRCRNGPDDIDVTLVPCRGILNDRCDSPYIKFIGRERFHEPFDRALRGTGELKNPKTCS